MASNAIARRVRAVALPMCGNNTVGKLRDLVARDQFVFESPLELADPQHAADLLRNHAAIISQFTRA
jgi:hypothetical protein